MLAFAALETDVDAAVLDHLANATVSIGGAQPVPAIFTRSYQQAGVGEFGMASAAPAVKVQSFRVPAQPYGLAVVVADNAVPADGGDYLIRETQPDGGLTVLILERAP